MKVQELKNKILIAELDPKCEYICLVNPILVRMDTLKMAGLNKRKIPIVIVHDIEKAIKFVEVRKEKTKNQGLGWLPNESYEVNKELHIRLIGESTCVNKNCSVCKRVNFIISQLK